MGVARGELGTRVAGVSGVYRVGMLRRGVQDVGMEVFVIVCVTACAGMLGCDDLWNGREVSLGGRCRFIKIYGVATTEEAEDLRRISILISTKNQLLRSV